MKMTGRGVAWREREDTMLRDETRRQEETPFVDELRFDELHLTHEVDTQRPREREDKGHRQITEQHCSDNRLVRIRG
jgi:hypothetical protein